MPCQRHGLGIAISQSPGRGTFATMDEIIPVLTHQSTHAPAKVQDPICACTCTSDELSVDPFAVRSSMVATFTSGVAKLLERGYSVVVLARPGRPCDRTIRWLMNHGLPAR